MSVFTILPVVSNNANLPLIDPSDIEFLDGYERTATHDWVFGLSEERSLVSADPSKSVLTKQNIIDDVKLNYVTLGGFGNALLSNVADSNSAVDSFALVIRIREITGINILGGTLGNAPINGGGGIIINSAGILQLNYRNFNFNGTTSPSLPGSLIEPNKWYFVGVSRNLSTGAKSFNLFCGGQGFINLIPTNGTYVSAGQIAVGNPNYSTVTGDDVDFAEAMFFDSMLNENKFETVYNLCKSRLKNRGIILE